MFTFIHWNARAHVLRIQMCFMLLPKDDLIVCLSDWAAAVSIKLFCCIHVAFTGWFRPESTEHVSSKLRKSLLVVKTKQVFLKTHYKLLFLPFLILQSDVEVFSIQLVRVTVYWATGLIIIQLISTKLKELHSLALYCSVVNSTVNLLRVTTFF
jgi:hypothetical protein